MGGNGVFTFAWRARRRSILFAWAVCPGFHGSVNMYMDCWIITTNTTNPQLQATSGPPCSSHLWFLLRRETGKSRAWRESPDTNPYSRSLINKLDLQSFHFLVLHTLVGLVGTLGLLLGIIPFLCVTCFFLLHTLQIFDIIEPPLDPFRLSNTLFL